MKPCPLTSLSLLLGVLLLSLGSPSKAEEDWRAYPLPKAELEQVVTDWLLRGGFEVQAANLGTGRTRLDARKGGETWEILLRPHSPLASEAQAAYANNGRANPDPSAALWDHIMGYLRSPALQAAGPDRDIPGAVLERIETVVCIYAQTPSGEIQVSGFAVDGEGLILCTAHALKSSREIRAVFHDGRTLSGRLVKRDSRRDLALIRVDGKPAASVPLSRGRKLLRAGERLYSIGCPENLGITVLPGVINGPPRRADDLPLWLVDMQIHPGSSGSPVFDGQGNLAAVVKGRLRGTNSLGFLIPMETILSFLEE